MLIGYVRCSTAEQNAPGTSTLNDQKTKIRAVGMFRDVGSYDIAFFADPGISGAVPLAKRPQGRAMLDSLQAGDVVVAAKLDRLFRSASDALATVERLHERKIKVILADLGTDPVTDSGSSKLFFTMLSAFAEFERTRIHERIIDGKRSKLERGGHTGGIAPFGYRVVGSGREAKLELHPEEQETVAIVRRVRRSHAVGSWHVVRRELEKLGVTDRAGHTFRVNQIQRICGRHIDAVEQGRVSGNNEPDLPALP